ncbi:hypothetical protein C922_04693 [Plasmodium inui San Antonio 1]|uniref:Uncharacterized protein n=1 Tax=Plasmodium inui San Antonio 1 TaxID=1237626 RepID=W7AI42_9APIC|nr:hypothetical protein C922_04693 [Plasmodium inui San Antonio 1]EUD64961.1 hypothetical protein C922_04693 [Plasmodium inui San Antonio 1]
MGGPGLSRYMEKIRTEADCSPPETGISGEEFTLCDLRYTREDGGEEVQNRVYPSGLKNLGNIVLNVDLKARILCKALHMWMSNWEVNPSGPQEWRDGSCDADSTGCFMARRDEKKCPYSDTTDLWTQVVSGTRLYRRQTYQMNLRTCMDIMSIILGVYESSLNSQKRLKKDEVPGICQNLYEQLKTWSDENIARKIMQDWFINKRHTRQQQLFRIGNGGATVDKWKDFVEKIGVVITGVQCSPKDGGGPFYDTSCVYVGKGSCEYIEREQEQYEELQEKIAERTQEISQQYRHESVEQTLMRAEKQLREEAVATEKSPNSPLTDVLGGFAFLITIVGAGFGYYIYRRGGVRTGSMAERRTRSGHKLLMKRGMPRGGVPYAN